MLAPTAPNFAPDAAPRNTRRAWSLAIAASVLLHLAIAGTVREGWLTLGTSTGTGAGTGARSLDGSDLLIPLDLAGIPTTPDPQQAAGTAAPLAESLSARPAAAPAIPPEFARAAQEPPPQPTQDAPPQLLLGIDDGDESSPNWLGGPQATEHTGLQSSVNQPAWSLNPGAPGAGRGQQAANQEAREATSATAQGPAQVIAPPAPEIAPQPQPIPQPVQQPVPQPQPQPAPKPAPVQGPEDALGTPVMPVVERDPVEVVAPTKVLPPVVEPAVRPATPVAQPQPLPQPTPGAVAQPTPERQAQQSSAAGGAGGSPNDLQGAPSDAESQAAATVPNVNFRPGTPLAAKGVRIITRAPRFSITARVASNPRNPTLELTFNREGKVVSGKFVEGMTSGYDDIDGPILDAAMRWTATGKKLAEVLGDDPKATFTIRITYLLNAQ